ncbi:MAG: hypothetical protein HY755_06335 [Nitrospirae bacterium]|nr:hypothetical protein [Nitrospirota bacterium]
MKVEDFKDDLISALKHAFPDANIALIEKRGVILEARVQISDTIFIEVYFSSVTSKKSFALIKNNQRIFGYDNYQYWHIHPINDPTTHAKCEEPSVEKVFEEMRKIIAATNF